MPNPVNHAWAAGFFDGEGCIILRRKKRPNGDGYWYSLCISCTQAEREPLELFVQEWGGTITHEKRSAPTRDIYRWQAACQIGARALRDMLPFLVVKREQAVEALSVQERKGRGLVPDRLAEEKSWGRLRDLKGRLAA